MLITLVATYSLTAIIMAAKQTVKTTTVKTVKLTGLAAIKKRKTRSDKGKKRSSYKKRTS